MLLTLDGSNSKLYKHWSYVPASIWIWKNFTPKEIASKGNNSILVVPSALSKLQALRKLIGKPLFINSAYRDPEHNASIGGKPHSNHLKGIAFDVSYYNQDKDVLYESAKEVGFNGFGFYPTFLHIDCGEPREWHQPISA